jgi:RNA polymerase sigma factor (TIGR02999 family)
MPTCIYKDFGDITQRLHNWSTGNRDAENELFEAVFPNLRRLAQYLMKGERYRHFLEPAELVNQIYFRLAAAKRRTWQNRKHFFAVAARAMRQYLIDYARARGDREFVSIEEFGDAIVSASTDLELLILVECLLEQLQATNRNWWKLVELKYLRGLTDEEAAAAMRIRLRTVQRMCADARQWLCERVIAESGFDYQGRTISRRKNSEQIHHRISRASVGRLSVPKVEGQCGVGADTKHAKNRVALLRQGPEMPGLPAR